MKTTKTKLVGKRVLGLQRGQPPGNGPTITEMKMRLESCKGRTQERPIGGGDYGVYDRQRSVDAVVMEVGGAKHWLDGNNAVAYARMNYRGSEDNAVVGDDHITTFYVPGLAAKIKELEGKTEHVSSPDFTGLGAIGGDSKRMDEFAIGGQMHDDDLVHIKVPDLLDAVMSNEAPKLAVDIPVGSARVLRLELTLDKTSYDGHAKGRSVAKDDAVRGFIDRHRKADEQAREEEAQEKKRKEAKQEKNNAESEGWSAEKWLDYLCNVSADGKDMAGVVIAKFESIMDETEGQLPKTDPRVRDAIKNLYVGKDGTLKWLS